MSLLPYMFKSFLAASVPFLVGYYNGAKRSTLLTRMNILSLFLVDPIQLFPEAYPRDGADSKVESIVQEYRWRWEAVAKQFELLLGKRTVNATKDIAIPSREQGRSIQARMYRSQALTSSSERLPVICEIHGGGWTFGSLSTYDGFCRDLAELTGAIVVACEYRLAPEHRFPKGLEDCEDVIEWLYNQDDVLVQFGGDPKSKGLAVCGDSAGGNLSAVLAVYCKSRDIPLRLQALLYPATCAFGLPLHRRSRVRFTHDSMVVNASGPVLSIYALLFCWQSYLGIDPNTVDSLVVNPRVSPSMFTEQDLKGVCPCYVVTASADVLRDEGIAYGEKLMLAGVPVKFADYSNTSHAFLSLPFADHFANGLNDLGKALKDAFSGQFIADSKSPRQDMAKL